MAKDSPADVVALLNKQFGAGTLVVASQAKALEMVRTPTGSLMLDIITGGGIPRGRVIGIVGEESTGKSVVAGIIVANAQKDAKREYEAATVTWAEREAKRKPKDTPEPEPARRRAAWVDMEGTFDEPWALLLGMDLDDLILIRPETAEIACDIMDALIRTGTCDIIVLDSIAAMTPQAEIEEETSKSLMGSAAKIMNRFWRKVSSAMNAIGKDSTQPVPTLITINQPREKIGIMFGDQRKLAA